MSLLCVNINALGGKRTENGRCGCHPPEWITPFNLSDLQCLHVGWCEVKLGRPLDFFYTGLPDHRRNSYLSLELIMPSLPPFPPSPPHSSWCEKVSFPHIARCSKKDYDFAGMCVRVCVRASNQWDCKRWRERTWNWLNCRGKIMEGNFPKAFTFESKCLMT